MKACTSATGSPALAPSSTTPSTTALRAPFQAGRFSLPVGTHEANHGGLCGREHAGLSERQELAGLNPNPYEQNHAQEDIHPRPSGYDLRLSQLLIPGHRGGPKRAVQSLDPGEPPGLRARAPTERPGLSVEI